MTHKNTLISIAMCTYNGERFIKEQLESILNQTHQNIELIITDDGSTDKTLEIIQEYQKRNKNSPIKLYKNKKNLGFIKNFEKAISLTNGDYIALADQDDIWKVNKLEIFIERIKDNLLIYSDAELIDKESKLLNKTLIKGTNKNLIKGNNNQAFLFDNCVSGNTLMFKKELIPSILPIPSKEIISFHDMWIAFVASSIGTITYTTESMTYYRRYDEQITRNKKNKYKSFFHKINEKEKRLKYEIKSALVQNNFFLTLPFLDKKTKILLLLINKHYINFEKKYFNYDLYQYLQQNKDTIFAIKNFKKRNRYVRNFSVMFRLKKLLLFSL